jgi:ribose 5-phosphate isomerase A
MKKNASITALQYVQPYQTIGIGTGSTVNIFIEQLAIAKLNIQAVSSSIQTTELLTKFHIPVIPFDQTIDLPVYIDGADAYNNLKQLIKGQGGALAKEKILAYASKLFVCIVDDSKKVADFNKTPITIEVLPMARSYISRSIVTLGGKPIYRNGYITENGNHIIDVYNLSLQHPIALEEQLNNIPGVVANGIFAVRPADCIIVGTQLGSVVL